MRPIAAGIAVDYELTEAPQVVSPAQTPALAVSTRAELYPEKEGPGHAPGAPVLLPDALPQTKEMIQFVLSEWSLMSLGYAAWRAGDLAILATKDMVPPGPAS
jgi:hypothetical protein